MNNTFLRYNESIAQSGVLQRNPGLAGEIKKMNEDVANCVKTANESWIVTKRRLQRLSRRRRCETIWLK
jgi:hypothetical protein